MVAGDNVEDNGRLTSSTSFVLDGVFSHEVSVKAVGSYTSAVI